MAITYKTVIKNAIDAFNSIQGKLAGFTDLGISATSVSNGTVSGSITPSSMISAIEKMATIKKSDGTFVSGKVTYRGSATSTIKPTISQNGQTITVSFSKTLSAGYYTGGTISQSTENTYTIPKGSVTITPSVSQSTFDGSSTTALSTDILLSSAPTSYYKVVMTPGSEKSVSAGYVTNSDVSLNSGLTVTKYIKKGSVSSSVSGTNPTFTPTVTFSGTKANYGITTTKPTSGTDGTNYLTVTPGGSSNSQTFTAGMSFTAGYIASKGTEGTLSVSASKGTVTPEYIPIVTPSFDGGSVTATATGLDITDTNTDPGTGIKIVPARAAVKYNGAVKGLVNVADNTNAMASGNNTYYVTKVSLPAGKKLGHYTSSTDYADGIEINGASGSIGTLYAGFATDGFGDLYLRNAGATSYKKVATAGKLVTASPSFDGGTLSGGGLSAEDSNLDLSDTNNGISFTVTRAAVSRAAVKYNGAVDGWVTKSDNTDALASGSLGSGSLTKYITGVNVPINTPFSVTMTADTAADTSSNLTITNAAYRNIGITNAANGIININGGNADKGVLINGAQGKTVTVDTVTVTNASGDLTKTSRSASTGYVTLTAGDGSASLSNNGNITWGDTDSGISVTATGSGTVSGVGYGKVSTGTGWITNGTTSSNNSASSSLSSNTAEETKYITGINVPKDKSLSVTMTADTSDGADTAATLSVSTAAYRMVSINGGGDKGILLSGANGKTAKVDGTTVTNANGDLITTSRTAGAGSITLTAGAGSVTGTNVTLSDDDNGISVSGSGTVSGVGKGTVSTGAGWITNGSTTSNEASDSKSSNTATRWITGVNVPKDKPFSVTMTADTSADTTSNLTVTNAAYRAVSINGGGDKGVLINGAKGKTAKVDGTTVTNADGDLLTTTLSEPTVSGATVTVSTGTGWITAGNKSATISSGTISTSEATTSNAVPTNYTENTTAVVPTKGWLLIGAGYYPNTAISLDTMLGGKDDGTTTAITAGYIRSGYSAYNIDGELIKGSIADWTPSSTYYTSTNTGYGAVTGNSYVTTATRYIKAAAGWSSTGSVSTAPAVTISKDINANISTSGTDTYGTGFLIKAGGTGSNGTVQTKYSISTAGWTPTKSNVNSGTVTVTPTVTNNYGNNYITKLTIPTGKTFGKYTSSTDYADGVTISGDATAKTAGTLYAGFSTSGYGDLYLRNAGTTSYTKVATAGKLITTSRSAGTGYVTLTAGAGSATLSKSDYITWGSKDNGILVKATGSGTVSGVGSGEVSTGTGWITTGTTKSNNSAEASLSSNTAEDKKWITGITVPKDKTFTVGMTADTTLDTTSNLTVTNAAYRNIVITNAANGTLTINGGAADKGVLINGANGKTVKVDNVTVTNASGDLITATPAFDGGAVSGSTSAAAASSQVTLEDTDTDPGTGLLVTASSSGTAKRAAVLYNGAVSGWLSKSDDAPALSAGSDTAIGTGTNKYYITKITLPAGKTLGHYTASDNYADGVTISGASGSIGKLYAGFNTDGYGELYLRNGGATSYKKVATAGKLITATPKFDGGGCSGGGLTQGTASGGGLTATGTNVEFSDTDNGISISVDRAAFSQTVTRAAVTRAAVLYNGAVNGWVNVADNASALAKKSSALASATSTVSLDAGKITKLISKITIPAGKTLGHYTDSNNYADGITINGAESSIGKLYAGFNTDGYGELYLRNGGATSYTKIGNAGKLITTSRSGAGGSVTSSGLTLDGSNSKSGISVTGSGSVSTRTGWITTGTTASGNSTKYVTGLTVPASKTLGSVTLTSGSTSARTFLTTLTVNGYTTVSNLNLTGIITTLTNNSGIIENLTGTNNRITNLGGTTTVTNLGSSSAAATLTVSTNTYGTVNIWNTGGDKGVQVANHTVKVDGTTVTNSSGDLTTTSRTAGKGSVSGANVTLGTTDTGIAVSGSGEVSTGSGWITSGTTSSNTNTKFINSITLPAGKTLGSTSADGIKIDGAASSIGTLYAGFNTSGYGDLYLRNAGTTSYTKVATGGKLTTAGSFSLSITNKATTTITPGDENGNSVGTGYYPLVASLTGTLSASTAGWFSSGSATDSSVIVGRVAKGSVSSSVSGTNPTVTPSVAITKAADYGFVTTAPSGTDGTNFLTINPDGSSNTQTFTASMSFTAGYIKSKGTEGTKSVSATIAAGTNYYVPIVSVTHAGGGASIKSSSTSATASGLTITDTDTDPGSGIYISTSGSATPKRAAVTYTNAKGVIAAHSGTTALSAADGSATTLTGNKYYVTEVSVPSGKTLSKVTNAGTITTLTGTGTIGTQSGTQTVTSNTGTITTTTNNGTVTVTTNAASKNVNIGTNNGNINITNASTGTVNYEDWKIYYNNSNKTIEFLFTE